MSARLPLGILLTAAPVLMVPAVSVVSLPLAFLVPLLVSAAGVLMVRTERLPTLRWPLAFTAACLAVALLGVAVLASSYVLPSLPIDTGDDPFPFLGVTVTGMWMAVLGGLGAASGAPVMAVTALAGTHTGRTSRA